MIPTDAKVYEVLALAMRYFFTLMGLIIVWRSFSWLRKDRRMKHRRLKQLPDAGTIGILTSISTTRSCLRSLLKAADEAANRKEPPIAFNDHN